MRARAAPGRAARPSRTRPTLTVRLFRFELLYACGLTRLRAYSRPVEDQLRLRVPVSLAPARLPQTISARAYPHTLYLLPYAAAPSHPPSLSPSLSISDLNNERPPPRPARARCARRARSRFSRVHAGRRPVDAPRVLGARPYPYSVLSSSFTYRYLVPVSTAHARTHVLSAAATVGTYRSLVS